MKKERRRFFRIDDTVRVAYRLLSNEEANTQSDKIDHPLDTYGLITHYDTKIEQGLNQLRIKDPLVGDLLDTLNKKLNTIVNQLELGNYLLEKIAHKIQQVNISACGMGFVVDERINTGQIMQLDLVLHPNNLHVTTLATVLACDPAPKSDQYYIRVNFHAMDQNDQEVLIQHIVKRQGIIIRTTREETNSNDSDNP